MTKPATKRERNIRKALERSLRNQPPGFRPRRKARRLAAKAGVEIELTRAELERKTVPELQGICEDRKIKFLKKQKKADLIEMIAGR